MVRITLKLHRPAIAMIELIFALVIMGIVMMSAPMLISTSNMSSSTAMQQESINQAVSRVNMIMGYAWDEQNTHDTYIPILHTTSGSSELNMVANTARRIGTPQESQRTYIFSDANSSSLFASTTLGLDASEDETTADDIDDFIGDITLTGTAGTVDYIQKENININTKVSYSSDSTASGYNQRVITFVPFISLSGTSSNIKSIEVNLTSTDTTNSDIFEKTIIFRAFSSNIGSYTLEERTF
jgi:type II secretory pathway pseudopilin PulG